VTDEDYKGNIGVILYNHSSIPFKIIRGDRIAQIFCTPIQYPAVQEVELLGTTERGKGGFGSTGTN
jgi:dUTP pyrophosphatase